MKIKIKFFIFIIINCVCKINNEEINPNTDSYLNALKNSHDIDTFSEDPRLAPTDYDQPNYYQSAQSIIDNGNGLGNPIASYDYQPKPTSVYGPPMVYGPPKPSYGPPAPIHSNPYPVYGPPHHSASPPLSQYFPMPREENWFLNKFKLKFDLFTIGKILLKIIIFKKIVKFLALICLLLFLPKLYHHKHEGHGGGSHEDSDERSFDHDQKMRAKVNEISHFARVAMAAFSKKYEPEFCHGSFDLACRFRRMFDAVDKEYPYGQIIKLYLPEDDELPEIQSELS